MMALTSTLRRSLDWLKRRAFVRSDAGNATIEFLLWFPALLSFFFLVFEASHVFSSMAEARRIMEDGNRQFVKGHFGNDVTGLTAWIKSEIQTFAPNVTVTASLDSAGLLDTRVSYPATDIDFAGLSPLMRNFTVSVMAVDQKEF